MKKFLSIILSLLMLISVLCGISFNALATTNGYTRTSAASYIENTICGHGWNIDGGGAGYDCVDLVYKYFRDLGNYYTIEIGNAYIYANSATLPSGWTRQYRSNGYTPQKGDIACWGTEFSSTGHVALVYAVDSNYVYVVEQVSSKNVAAYKTKYSISSPKCFIVPDFSSEIQYGAPIDGLYLTVSSGEYHIVSALNKNMGLDAENGKTDNNTNVCLYNNINDSTQVFVLKYLGDGFYSIIHKNSQKSLDVDNASLAYGTNLKLYNYYASDAQKWVIVPADDGYFYIKSKCNGLCVDVTNAAPSNKANIQMYGGNNSNAQKWAFIAANGNQSLPNGDYHIVSALNNNYGLDLANCENKNGTNVQLYNNKNNANQLFNVNYNGNGYYTITHKKTNKVLDMYNNGTISGANISIYDSNGTDAQKWIIKSDGKGYYCIIAKNSGLYVDVKDGIVKNSNNIWGYVGNNTKSQKWKFICDTHTWNSGEITTVPTYTATGIKTYSCTVCGETKSEAIAMLAKKANTLSVKGKTVKVKFAKLKKKKQTIAINKAMTVSNAQGAVTYAKASGNKKITVAKNGKITVKKGLKKGAYKVKIKVTAAGNDEYNAAVKTVTVTIKVK